MMQLALQVNKVACVRETVYFYIKHKESITGKTVKGQFTSLIQSFVHALCFLLDRYPYEQRIREELSYHMVITLNGHCLYKKEKWVRDALWCEFRKTVTRKRVYKYSRKTHLNIWSYILLGIVVFK